MDHLQKRGEESSETSKITPCICKKLFANVITHFVLFHFIPLHSHIMVVAYFNTCFLIQTLMGTFYCQKTTYPLKNLICHGNSRRGEERQGPSRSVVKTSHVPEPSLGVSQTWITSPIHKLGNEKKPRIKNLLRDYDVQTAPLLRKILCISTSLFLYFSFQKQAMDLVLYSYVQCTNQAIAICVGIKNLKIQSSWATNIKATSKYKKGISQFL